MEKEILRKILLVGLTDIMFDRYPGNNKMELPPERKMYFMADGKTLMLPAANVMSFLSAQKTDSAPKRFLGKGYKQIAQAFLSYATVQPFEIPFTREGKPIIFDGFSENGNGTGFHIHDSVPRGDKGVARPKLRPVLSLPWELKFQVTLFPNDEGVNDEMLYDMFRRGGLAIGFGTYRGVYGKFSVENWE